MFSLILFFYSYSLVTNSGLALTSARYKIVIMQPAIKHQYSKIEFGIRAPAKQNECMILSSYYYYIPEKLVD